MEEILKQFPNLTDIQKQQFEKLNELYHDWNAKINVISRKDIEIPAELEILIRRLQGVVTARMYVLLDYDIPKSLVDKACAITPGLESPTISPLQNADWVAVRAMVKRKETNDVMDELWALGARGILVTDIHACRL